MRAILSVRVSQLALLCLLLMQAYNGWHSAAYHLPFNNDNNTVVVASAASGENSPSSHWHDACDLCFMQLANGATPFVLTLGQFGLSFFVAESYQSFAAVFFGSTRTRAPPKSSFL